MHKLLEKHIEFVDAVNSADSEIQHTLAERELYGFRRALEALNINQLMECDWHYLNKGIDRPMCCGVFLDWQPAV